MWVPFRKLLNAAMTLLGGGAPPAAHKLSGSFLGLLKAPVSLTIDSDDSVCLIREANFQGYARVALGIDTIPFTGQGAFTLVQGDAKLWQPTGDDTTNTIFGHFIVGSDSVTVLGAEIYDVPIPLPDSGSGFVDVPIIGLGPNISGYGKSIISGN